jgi:hypothetical protein
MPGFFNRFGKLWALSGTLNEPTDAAAAEGFANIGQATPTVEQFNALFRYGDAKDNYLFELVKRAVETGGETLTESSLDALAALFASAKGGLVRYQSPGNYTFTVPRLVTTLYIRMWGAGGGGGGAAGGGIGSAGGGAGYGEKKITVVPGAVISLTVGARGVRGEGGASLSSGNPGGNSTFGVGFTCFGGGGGVGAGGGIQYTVGVGGGTSGADFSQFGSGAEPGALVDGIYFASPGGGSGESGYGVASPSAGAPGNDAVRPGMGGNGGTNTGPGGYGGNGLIIVEW